MNNSVGSVETSFRANATNETGQKYYKSNKGAIAGAIMAVPAVYYNAQPAFLDFDKLVSRVKDSYKKLGLSETKIEEIMNEPSFNNARGIYEKSKQFAIPFAIIAGACTLGAGVLFDRVRNKKASAAAKDLANGNYNGIYANGGAVDFSKTGVPYYKYANGVKYGFLTGMACGAVHTAMNYSVSKKFDRRASLLNVLLFGLGGVIMGSIAQKSSNKAAEKSTYA